MPDAATLLMDALKSARPVTLSLADLGPRGLLEALAADGATYAVRVESMAALVEVEIGNGLVVGARAHRDGAVLEGREAYALLRGLRRGTAEVTPKRFSSMANVLEPIAALPDLGRLSSAPPPGDPDTIEVPLPEARPVVTEEIELPPELCPPRVVARPSLPPPAPRLAPPPLRPEVIAPPKRARTSRRAWAIGAAMLVGVSGLATVALAALGGREEVAAPAAIEPATPVAVAGPEPAPEPEEEAAPEHGRSDARALARQARSLLRQGRARPALWRARRAARMRPGLPYYQVVLGDALAANGQDAAARRAWRRALRLRPGYRAAVERLAGDSRS